MDTIKNTILFAITQNKYLAVNVTKHAQDLYIENKALMKEN